MGFLQNLWDKKAKQKADQGPNDVSIQLDGRAASEYFPHSLNQEASPAR